VVGSKSKLLFHLTLEESVDAAWNLSKASCYKYKPSPAKSQWELPLGLHGSASKRTKGPEPHSCC
jgi:hypothetical protein